MIILIKIENREVKIGLKEGKREVDSIKIIEERSLSERLLPEIDGLIRKNKLKTQDIKEIKVESDQADSFTTTRIAKAVANVWNWAS
jgi:tRNA A37 threonylcarbamoyladenosine modification protein TsaB